MVDDFIQELKDICIDCFNDSEKYIFFLGLTKLIDNFSRSSKAEMRKEFFKIKDEYDEEGAIFFELFPKYRNMKGVGKGDYSSFEQYIYNLKTTENGLNTYFEYFNRVYLPTNFKNELFNSINNCELFKKLYDESSRINKSYLNVYNVSSYDLNSFSKKFYDASKISKDYDELQKIVNDYFGGFDINIFILLSNFERNILDIIIIKFSMFFSLIIIFIFIIFNIILCRDNYIYIQNRKNDNTLNKYELEIPNEDNNNPISFFNDSV